MEIVFKKLGYDLPLQKLKSDWIELELNSDNSSFFISWSWIETWLSHVDLDCHVLIAQNKGKILSLGLYYKNSTKIGLVQKDTMWLNKTGEIDFDQVWIEYNDLLFDKSLSENEKQRIRAYPLEQQNIPVQEVHYDLNECLPSEAQLKSTTQGYITYLREQNKELDVLSSFSKNTRQQITRSQKILAQNGKLSLKIAQTPEHYFDEICIKHRQQWRKSIWGSGFDNPNFYHFHQELSNKSQTQQIKLELDGKAIAYGYYFLFKKNVFFYLSAIEKYDDNRIKVGLVFHYLAMKHFQSEGFEVYDFLGGDARYKKSMSNDSYTLYSWYLESDNLFAKLKRLLKRFKLLINKRCDGI